MLASLFCACGNGWFAQRIRACEWAGIENLVVCATNAMSVARSLDKRTALDAVLVDLSLKDVSGDAGDHRNGMFAVLDEISDKSTDP